MIKMPKLSDLTDVNKLKDLGNTLMDNAMAGVDKVKNTVSENAHVGELMNKVKSTINTGKTGAETPSDELHVQAAAIKQSLEALFEAQKQQVALMNALKKQVNHFLAAAGQSTQEAEPTIHAKSHAGGHKSKHGDER
jgi:hypothetical protein